MTFLVRMAADPAARARSPCSSPTCSCSAAGTRRSLRFTSVDLLDSVAPKRSGWQRHLPAVGVLASLVVMTLAFAQPAMALRTPVDRATILLALDTSGSMTADDVDPTRLDAAKDRARDFVDSLPDGVQVGIVTFNSNARLVVAPTQDRAQLLSGIDSLKAGGATATSEGIRTSLAAIAGVPAGRRRRPPAPAAIVLMSDGTPTVGSGDGRPGRRRLRPRPPRRRPPGSRSRRSPSARLTASPPCRAAPSRCRSTPPRWRTIAQASGGRSFTAETAGQLGSIYDEIGRDLAYTETTQDISAIVAGIGLALLIAAAAAALFWTQRLL